MTSDNEHGFLLVNRGPSQPENQRAQKASGFDNDFPENPEIHFSSDYITLAGTQRGLLLM